MKKLWIGGLLLALSAAGVWAWRHYCGKSTEIVIVSTNDIHGAIEQIPRLATLVERIRRENDHVLLVDAGDKWTGNPYVDLYPEKGKPVVDLMNELDYDLGTVGNHGFDYGPRLLDRRIGDSRFPTILANMRSDSAYLSSLPSYAFETVDGVKLCFLGLIDNSRDGHPDGFSGNFAGLHFADPLLTARSFESLRDSCDILIGLTHIGVGRDSLMAMQMPGLDLIVGGHSHTVMPQGRTVNGVLITQTGKSLRYAGLTRLTYRCGRLEERTNTLVMLDTVAADPRIAALVADYLNNPELKRPIGTAAPAMDKTALANFMTDAVRDAAQADFALVNWNSIRIDSLPAGDFTVADLFAMEPFSNSINWQPMRLADLREMILNKFNEEGKEGHTVDIYLSGGRYAIGIDGEGNGRDVRFYDLRGDLLPDDDRTYRVALSDYVDKTYDFSLQGRGEPVYGLITDALREYVENHTPLRADSRPRVSIESHH